MNLLLSRPVFCRLIFQRSVLTSLLSPFFGLLAGGLLVDCFGPPPPLTLSSFCRMTLKSHAGAYFPNVSDDPTGLISVPVNPALLLVILRLVVMQDSSKANPLRGGDAEPPVPGRADSSMSPQRPLGLKCLCEPPACNPHGSVWTLAAVVRDCGHARG